MRFLVAAFAAALILVVPPVATAACPGADPCPYSAAGVVGQRAEGVLRFPQASAVGPDGSIYVGDQLSHTIQVFGPDGAFRREIGVAGSGPGGLSAVGAVAVAADGSVYVADGADRIDRFAADGTLQNSWGSSGSAPGQFHFGAGGGNDSGAGGGIAIGPDGSVYVADTRNDRIQRFAADGTSPVVIVPPGRLSRPQGLAVSGSRLIVADDVHHRLAIFNTGGTFITTVGTGEGNRPGELQNPYDVAVDPAGRVYVADNSNHRVVRYGPAPGYTYRARWGAFGSGKGQLQFPRGIAVDAAGHTYVADPGWQPDRRVRRGGRVARLVRLLRARRGAVHPAARRRRRRGRDARGRRFGQRADRAAEPGRRGRRDVRRSRARPDAAARPGGRGVRRHR